MKEQNYLDHLVGVFGQPVAENPGVIIQDSATSLGTRLCSSPSTQTSHLREDSDLLQRDLAEYLQCSQVCYSHYEMGKRDIPTDVLIKLADFYHTSTDYLLARTDEKSPYPKPLDFGHQ